ncbi:hypothetical protein HKD37_06G016806 [Glycine soja]
MHDEVLQSFPQSYEFTPQQHHHQDYGYNLIPITSFPSFTKLLVAIHQPINQILMTLSKKSNMLFLINNFNHKNMDKYVDRQQETSNLPENVSALVYCYVDMIPSYERIVFECPSGPKVITSSEDMPLDALRETIFDVNRGCRILLDLFTINKFICVEYDYMELKHNDDVGKMFFTYSGFSTKDLIELNAAFGHSPNEILAMLHKPRKPRTDDEIIVLMHNESV